MSFPSLAEPLSGARIRAFGLSWWAVAVWVGATVYSVLLSIEAVREHHRFETFLDLAVYDQLLWLLANGHEPFSTVISRPLLGGHFQPGVALLTPLYWLDLGVPALLTAQSVALALTAPALYALARAYGASPPLAAVPAFLWLVCPWVASVNLFEFRPDPFAPALIVVSVLTAVQRRYVWLAVTALLALSLKEDVSLTYVMLGIVLALQGFRRVGGLLALGSAAWFVVATAVVNASGGANEAFGRRFAGERGDSVGDALVWAVTHPFDTLGDFVRDSLGGLLLLVVSTGGLALLAPVWMLLSLPTALHNALSAHGPQHELHFHYHLGTLTGFFVAAAIGAARVPGLGRPARLAVLVVGFAAIVTAFAGGLSVHQDLAHLRPSHAASAELALARIPNGVSVAATPSLLPHLSQRVEIYSLPEPFVPLDWGGSLAPAEFAERARGVRFVAYLERDISPSGGYSASEDLPSVRRLLLRSGFVEIARVGRVHILERPLP